jgi:hypothetical protein
MNSSCWHMAEGRPSNRVASEQQSVRLKSWPGREFTADRLFRPQTKVLDNVKTNYRLFCESFRQWIHSQIVIATIEWPSRTSLGAPSLVDVLHPINCPRPTPYQPTQFSCAAKRPRCLPVNDDSPAAAEVAEAHPLSELVRTEPHAAVGRNGMASTRKQTPRRRLRPIASGHRQSGTERAIGSDLTLNAQQGIGFNDASNVEKRVTGECQVICW